MKLKCIKRARILKFIGSSNEFIDANIRDDFPRRLIDNLHTYLVYRQRVLSIFM